MASFSCAARLSSDAFPSERGIQREERLEVFGLYRLSDVVGHAGGEGLLSVALQRVRGQG